MYRDLSLAYLSRLPARPDEWSDSELADYRASLEAVQPFDARQRDAWERMLQNRSSETGALAHRRMWSTERPLPAEVLAELQPADVATRVHWAWPELAVLSDRMGQFIACMQAAKPSAAASRRLSARSDRLYQRRRLRHSGAHGAQRRDNLLLPGGLVIGVQGDTIHIVYRGHTYARVPASDKHLPLLRRFVFTWLRFVQLAVASSIEPALIGQPAAAGDVVQWVISEGFSRNAGWYDRDGGIRHVASYYPLRGSLADDRAGKRSLARRWLTAMRWLGQGDDRLHTAIESAVLRALETFKDGVGLFDRLTPPVDAGAALLRVDDDTRRFVHAFRSTERVTLDQPADRYEVYQDDVCFPQKLATLHSLALAVDFERSNRKAVGMRLSLSAGGDGAMSYRVQSA